ncbi:MAG: hypothetical protein JNM27_02330 [Leptospirales bacterium]|nr:hypothetical protein [Leptospirales bacterium]
MNVITNFPVFFRDMALIIKAEIKRDLLYMKRYPLEILSFIFFMFLILLAIVWGVDTLLPKGSKIMDAGSGFAKERMVLGYCLMQFVLATQMGWSGQIQNESQTGTLEQLSISGHSLGGVLFARGVAQLPRQIISFFLMLGCYKLALPETGIDLSKFYLGIIDLCILAIGIFGVSYVFAGLTLLFKRVGFFFQIINFAFLGLFWQSRDGLCAPEADPATCNKALVWLFDHFPLTIGMTELTSSMTHPSMHSPYTLFEFGVYSVVFMCAGYMAFRWMENRARAHGLLSQY